jgi:hypothetical protein
MSVKFSIDIKNHSAWMEKSNGYFKYEGRGVNLIKKNWSSSDLSLEMSTKVKNKSIIKT